MSLWKEIIFPGGGLNLDGADVDHEFSLFHGGFRHHRPLSVLAASGLRDKIDGQS